MPSSLWSCCPGMARGDMYYKYFRASTARPRVALRWYHAGLGMKTHFSLDTT